MIISNNIPPEKNLYFLGAEVLKFITRKGKDVLSLYKVVSMNININFVLYIYTLDWLYIANSINIDEKGIITKCL